MKITRWNSIVAIVAFAMGVSQSQGATLKVGDPAPKLQVGKWVQGEPVKEFAPGKAYIVEFWATWCGPCRVSIPHLNEIHKKFEDKGLIVIGQDCWEQKDSLVEPFVKKMGDKMTYRVVLDDKEGARRGKMAETWMQAAGQNGIPTAFLVNNQAKIAWIGHPMALEEKVIEEVLAGKHDLQKAAAEYEVRTKNQAQIGFLSQQFNRNLQNKEWDKAESTLGELEKLMPEGERMGLGSSRIQLLLRKGDLDGAAKLADELSESHSNDAMFQNRLAWQLAITEGLKGEALDKAANIASRANIAAGEKDPEILDTLARLTFIQGHKDKAIELQQKAVSLAENDAKTHLRETLDSYKEGKLPQAQ